MIDNGPGIPPEIKTRIFEPFFTTKPVGEGTGLGLDTVRRIIQNHHGDVTFDSRPGETRFVVRIPFSKSA
jgi:signal transduction histidine kinase